ncbi:hypothetical protein AAD046_09380 [Providencia rettgeri]
MAGTIPTKKSIPSKDIRDLGFNSEKVDEVVNSENNFYRDRFDNDRLTIKGLERSAASAGPAVEAAINAVEQANEARRTTEQLKSESSSFVQSAVDSAASAQRDAERAENAAASAESKGESESTYPDIETGLLQTQSGQYFRVPTDSDPIAFVYYKNNNGTAERVTDTPSGTALSNIQRTFTTTVNQDAVTFEDAHGRKAVAIKDDGTLQAGLVDCQGILTSSNDGWLAKLLVDQHGNVALGVDERGVTHGFFQDHGDKEDEIETPRISYALKFPIVSPNHFEGTTQQARINAALDFLNKANGGTLELSTDTIEPSKGNQWLLSSALLLDSHITIYLNKSTLKLANGIFDNIIRSSGIEIDPANPNAKALNVSEVQDIKILGSGKDNAFIEGPNVPYSAPHPIKGGAAVQWVGDWYGWRTVGILLANCKNYEIAHLTMRKTTCWAISQERGCEDMHLHDLHFDTTVKNGDGIDFRMGCKNGVVERISGNTNDDLIALSALLNFVPNYPQGNYIWPLQVTADNPSPLGNDIENIRISDVTGVSRENLVRILLSGGAKVKGISISNVSDTAEVGKQLVIVSTGYGMPSGEDDLSGITVNNVSSHHSKIPLNISAPIKESAFNFIRQYRKDGEIYMLNENYPMTNTQITNAKKVN